MGKRKARALPGIRMEAKKEDHIQNDQKITGLENEADV